MERYRRNYNIARVINVAAAAAGTVWYYIAYALGRVFGKTSQSLLALNIHARSEVVTTMRGVRFVCSNVNYYLRVKATYDKEAATLRWIDSFPPQSRMWDVGANVGCLALYAATRGHRVWAFEPQPPNYAALSVNIIANSLSNVCALNIALYSDTKVSELNGLSMEAGAAWNVFDRSLESVHSSLRTLFKFNALSMRADELIERFSLPVPDFIKLDVDGNELDILEGAPALLANSGLKGMLIEMTPAQADYEPILQLLDNHGFKPSLRDVHGTVENVVFVRK